MQITETIKRECCERRDLRPYKGACAHPGDDGEARAMLFFCIHCGQAWEAKQEILPTECDMKKTMARIAI